MCVFAVFGSRQSFSEANICAGWVNMLRLSGYHVMSLLKNAKDQCATMDPRRTPPVFQNYSNRLCSPCISVAHRSANVERRDKLRLHVGKFFVGWLIFGSSSWKVKEAGRRPIMALTLRKFTIVAPKRCTQANYRTMFDLNTPSWFFRDVDCSSNPSLLGDGFLGLYVVEKN